MPPPGSPRQDHAPGRRPIPWVRRDRDPPDAAKPRGERARFEGNPRTPARAGGSAGEGAGVRELLPTRFPVVSGARPGP